MSEQIIGNIRCTDNQLISILDLIKVVNGEDKSEQILQEIIDNNPEIKSKITLHQFDNLDPELTTVTDQETALKIIDLLPDNLEIKDLKIILNSFQKN